MPRPNRDYRKKSSSLAYKGVKLAVVVCIGLSALGKDLPVTVVDAAEALEIEIVGRTKENPGKNCPRERSVLCQKTNLP